MPRLPRLFVVLFALISALLAPGLVSSTVSAAPQLTGLVEQPPLGSHTDLTAEGNLDWWLLGHAGGALNRKAGANILGAPQPYNNALWNPFEISNPDRPTFSWSDGAPIASFNNSSWTYFVNETNKGFQWSLPLSSATQRLVVYLGAFNTSAEFSASFSDGSVVPYVATLTTAANAVRDWVITLDVSGTPGETVNMVYQRTGSTGNIGLQAVTLSGANPASTNTTPVITSPASQANIEGESVTLQVSATDTDNDTLTYSATGLPNQLAIDAGTGQITGTVTEAGTYNVTITVNDNNGGTDMASFTWVVTAPTPTGGLALESLVANNISSSNWSTVNFSNAYIEPVAVCSVRYVNNTLPQIVRMRNATSTNVEIQLQNPSNASLNGETVDCLIVEAGAWTLPDGRAIEAHRVQSTVTDEKRILDRAGTEL